MNRFFVALAFAATVFSSIPAVAAPHATSGDTFIRIQRVREFVPESANTVLLREAKTKYTRVTTAGDCPVIADANRIGFQVGTNVYNIYSSGQYVGVTGDSVITQISAKTPHAAIVLIQDGRRYACSIASITAIEPSVFTDAAAAGLSRDNRYSGDTL